MILAGYIGLCVFYAIVPTARSVAHFASKHPIHLTRGNLDSAPKPQAVGYNISDTHGRLVIRSITHAYREVKPLVSQIHLPTLDIVVICLILLLAAFTGLMVYLGRRRARGQSMSRQLSRPHQTSSFLAQDSTLDDSERGLNTPGSTTPRLGYLIKQEVEAHANTNTFTKTLSSPKTSLFAEGVPSFFSRSERDLLAGVQEYGYHGQ